MRVQITAVHMVAGGSRHEHIAQVQWTEINGSRNDTASRQDMVDWLHQQGNQAWVYGGGRWIEVKVVDANPPYIRTYADGVWSDNLLALPRY